MNTENFTGKAEAYAKGRPGYPKAAIETIVGLAPSGAVFADIGAGMGKFTVKLAERGYSVFAVEPNADITWATCHYACTFSKRKDYGWHSRSYNTPRSQC